MLYKSVSAWTHLSNFDQSEHKHWTIVERDQRVTMVRKVSLKFIRLPRVVFFSQVTEGVTTTRSNRMKFRLEKSEKLPSSLLVFLNDWLTFCVWDQFEIKMLIARGLSDINTTLSVIMSLFCCRSLCLSISLSRCLCLFILALSRSACRRFSL